MIIDHQKTTSSSSPSFPKIESDSCYTTWPLPSAAFLSDSYNAAALSIFFLSVTLFNLKKSSLLSSSNSFSIYLIVSAILGMTTYSKALTLLFVTLMTSSNVMNLV